MGILSQWYNTYSKIFKLFEFWMKNWIWNYQVLQFNRIFICKQQVFHKMRFTNLFMRFTNLLMIKYSDNPNHLFSKYARTNSINLYQLLMLLQGTYNLQHPQESILPDSGSNGQELLSRSALCYPSVQAFLRYFHQLSALFIHSPNQIGLRHITMHTILINLNNMQTDNL